MNIDKLTLLSGMNIPIPEFRTSISQPKLKDISIIGESSFYEHLGIFKINKEDVINNVNNTFESAERAETVKTQLSFYTDFQIVLEMQRESQSLEIGITTILMLLFPQYDTIKYEDRFILMNSSVLNRSGKAKYPPIIIDDNKWSILQDIVSTIFCLGEGEDSEESFNPASEQARLIAEKIKKRRALLNQNQGGNNSDGDVLANIASSISTAMNLDLNKVFEYTVYQLFNQLKRYDLHEEYLNAIKSLFAGAKRDDVDVVNWRKKL